MNSPLPPTFSRPFLKRIQRQKRSPFSGSRLSTVYQIGICFPTPTQAFHHFRSLPSEVHLKIWHKCLPPSLVVAVRPQPYALLPQLPAFPLSVLAFLHTSHEARSEVLAHYKLLPFPMSIFYYTPLKCEHTSCPAYRPNAWAVPRCGQHRNELEMRWESRGIFTVNVRSDLVFFGRWATRIY